MSSASSSRHSYDAGSEIGLLQTEKFPEFEDVEIEQDELNKEWTHRFGLTSKPWIPCCGNRARLLAGTGRLLWFLLPSFIQSTIYRDTRPSDRLHPTAYLDGMRGLAAFAVFLCHLSYGTWSIVYSYGSGGMGENNRFIQLPIIRLFYSGPPMVAIFFVVSGYVLSYKPIRLMRANQYEALLISTSSSVFRRALRLYLPCFISTFLVAILAQIGLFDLTVTFARGMRGVKEYHMTAAPSLLEQISRWAKSMFSFVSIFDWTLFAGSTEFDQHLWTIPVEYRCSLLLFLTHILLAQMSTRFRILTLLFLLLWGTLWDRWDMTLFWAGQFLAELHHIKASREAAAAANTSPLDERRMESMPRRRRILRGCLVLFTFVLGCYLASSPDLAAHVSPGYMFLDSLIPSYWSQRHRFWPGIGAILIVSAAGNLNILRSIFTIRPIQYLGKISFPLYVMHGLVTKTFGYMVMQQIYILVGIEQRWRFELAFFLSTLIIIPATIWVADIFWRAVDIPCVRFSKWLEAKMFG